MSQELDYNLCELLRWVPLGTRLRLKLKGDSRTQEDLKVVQAALQSVRDVQAEALREIDHQTDDQGRYVITFLKCGELLSPTDEHFVGHLMPYVDELIVYPPSEDGAFTYTTANWLQYLINNRGYDDEETISAWEAKYGIELKRPQKAREE
jgi:hypothetical protein